MEREWIPPESDDVGTVGTDEDLKERQEARPEFLGEFGEREEAARHGPRETPERILEEEETNIESS